jgi:sugar/nucleoside kinase (ribokinase family)
MHSDPVKIAGLGGPVIDILIRVDDATLTARVRGEKGGMNKISGAEQRRLISLLEAAGGIPAYAIGGSAFNTIAALARLGMKTSFIGKTGKDDAAEFFRRNYLAIGGDCSSLKATGRSPSATVLCIVTPDSQRTMRSSLAASLLMRPEDLCDGDFSGVSHLHIEGYQFFNPGLVKHAVEMAKAHGCTVSLDLASFEVVRRFRDDLEAILDRIDIVFANEDEARAFMALRGELAPEAALKTFSKYCRISVVKTGVDGAWIRRGNETVHVAAKRAVAVDTTGAGDLWQAGFLYGLFRDWTLEKAGKLGAYLAAEVVKVLGAQLPAETWETVRRNCKLT